jgi:hypothetical protein
MFKWLSRRRYISLAQQFGEEPADYFNLSSSPQCDWGEETGFVELTSNMMFSEQLSGFE